MFIKQMTVGMMGVCCYIVACEQTKEAVIIDPGGNEEDILAACQEENLKVKYIVNTHGHPDHVCGNKLLKDATGADIVMHTADAGNVANFPLLFRLLERLQDVRHKISPVGINRSRHGRPAAAPTAVCPGC